jgi:hypothetical protein
LIDYSIEKTKEIGSMLLFLRTIIVVMVFLPLHTIASDSVIHIEKKPAGLRKSEPGKDLELTVSDRLLWKSILHWCDECEERSKRFRERLGDVDESFGGIAVYPLNEKQYLVDVECAGGMQQSEHIYYKVTEHSETIESRLLSLEQFYVLDTESPDEDNAEPDPSKERVRKDRFIKFTDPLIYGLTMIDQKKKLLIVEKRYKGVGGCGLLTTYDVSGDRPKVVEFRGRMNCSANYVPPKKWKLYPAKQRAKWRVAPNPQREDWKNKDQCR